MNTSDIAAVRRLAEHPGTSFAARHALRDLADENERLRAALERIADQRNTHFAGDAQVVAREALAA